MRTLLKANADCTKKEQEFHLLYRQSKLFTAEFVKEFRRVRKERNISLRAAAKMLRISPAYLSDIELVRRPPNLGLRSRMIKILV